MMTISQTLRRVAATGALTALATSALASGPLNTNPNDPDGVERWPNGGQNIPFNPDGVPVGGPTALALGPLTYEEAVADTVAAFARWQGISSASATYSNNGPMPFDIDVTNYFPFVTNLFFGENVSDGFSPIVYDADGSIFVDLFGVSGVLGFASTDTRDADGNPIEAVSFLNGGAILGGFPVEDFRGVTFHEFGHYSGLGHTVVNGENVALGDETGPSPFNTYGPSPQDQIETMYPFAVVGGGQVDPHADDIGFYSFLYPAPNFFAESGTITGTIFGPNGETPLTGVNVIARNVDNPFEDAVSAISGDRTQPGVYTINGLTPGANYTVHVDQILQGGFSTPPLQPLPGPEEFYNGGNESNNVAVADDPSESVPVPTVAGTPTTGIDIIFNSPRPGDPLPLGLDDNIELFLPFTVDFCGEEYNSVFVNTAGNITFGAPDPFGFIESPAAMLGGPPRIAGLWDDLNPLAGGFVTFEQDDFTFSVIFNGIPEFPVEGANTFKITLYKSLYRIIFGDDERPLRGLWPGSKIGIDIGDATAVDGIVGYSCGGARTSGFELTSDLSELRQPIRTFREEALFEQFTIDAPNDLVNDHILFRGTRTRLDLNEPNDTADRATRVHLPFDTIDRYSEIDPERIGDPDGSDIDWYRFEAEEGTTLIADIQTGQLDTVLGLYSIEESGCEGLRGWRRWFCRPSVTATQIAFDDDGGAGLLSRIVFPITETGKYAVAVSTFPDSNFEGNGGSGGRYVINIDTIDGTLLSLGDDSSVEVPLEFAFPFQGETYTSVFVNSNGNLTFGSGDTDFSESTFELLGDQPRIAPLWDDLSPNQGGLVIADSDSGSFSVTFQDVPEFFATTGNTFTVTLDAGGNVTISYGAIAAADGIVGVSPGGGAADPGSTDLSAATSLSAVGTTYEQFDFLNPNDLSFLLLVFSNP